MAPEQWANTISSSATFDDLLVTLDLLKNKQYVFPPSSGAVDADTMAIYSAQAVYDKVQAAWTILQTSGGDQAARLRAIYDLSSLPNANNLQKTAKRLLKALGLLPIFSPEELDQKLAALARRGQQAEAGETIDTLVQRATDRQLPREQQEVEVASILRQQPDITSFLRVLHLLSQNGFSFKPGDDVRVYGATHVCAEVIRARNYLEELRQNQEHIDRTYRIIHGLPEACSLRHHAIRVFYPEEHRQMEAKAMADVEKRRKKANGWPARAMRLLAGS